MSTIKGINSNGVTHTLRDVSTFRSLTSTQAIHLDDNLAEAAGTKADGKYNGEEVQNGEVFTCNDGSFKKFIKTLVPHIPNYNVIGDLTISDGIATSTTFSGRIETTSALNPQSTDSWSIETKVRFTANISNGQRFAGVENVVELQSGANEDGRLITFWIAQGSIGISTPRNISQNQYYYLKAEFDGTDTYKLSVSTDNENWTEYTATGNPTSINSAIYFCSLRNDDWLRGDLDLNETVIKVNGSIVWSAYTSTYDYSLTKLEGALPSQTGNAGKFLTTDGTDLSWNLDLVEKLSTIPVPEGTAVGRVVMYTGENTASYEHGYVYECKQAEPFYIASITFSPDKYDHDDSVCGLMDFLQMFTPDYLDAASGTIQFREGVEDEEEDIYEDPEYTFICKDANNNTLFNETFAEPEFNDMYGFYRKTSLTDGEVVNFTITIEEDEPGYYWDRIDVQPSSGGETGITSIVSPLNTLNIYNNPEQLTGLCIDARPMIGTDGEEDGQAGLVPTPPASAVNKFLRGDGAWSEAGGNVELQDIAFAGKGILIEDAIEDFTVIGSPTITDGIVSNFTGTDKISIPQLSSITSSFELTMSCVFEDTDPNQGVWPVCATTTSYGKCGIFQVSGMLFSFYGGAGWGGENIDLGYKYWLKIVYDSGYTKFLFLKDNNYTKDTLPALSSWTQIDSVQDNYFSTANICFGNDIANDGWAFTGSINLNDTSISIDGNSNYWSPYPTDGKPAITADIGSGASAPTSLTEGYVGKLYVTDSGDAYICTDVNGSTYTWAQINGGGSSINKYTTNNTALTSVSDVCTWTVTHNLGTKDVVISIYDLTTGTEPMYNVIHNTTNSITIELQSSTDIVADSYRVVVLG